MTDWPNIHRALWRQVQTHSELLQADTATFVERLLTYTREAGNTLTPQAEAELRDYLTAMDAQIRIGIETAVGGVAGAAVAAPLRDAFVTQRAAEAYARRWPDGLTLSDRVWSWQSDVRRGVSETLAEGVRLGESVNGLVYKLQRQVEAGSAGARFAIATQDVDDWASDLAAEARRVIRNPAAWDRWRRTVDATERHINLLKEGGTRRQAEAAFAAIRKAVNDGSQAAVDAGLKWWVYDRQLATLKRTAITEMATAHHRAIVDATQDDEFVIGYRWRLSASHPEPDICDYYANIELGLGAGVWPKDRVPDGKAHPHCMCYLIPVTKPRAQQGATSYGELLAAAPAATAAKLQPKWAAHVTSMGVPHEALMRADGLGFRPRAELRAAWGAERWDALETIGKARSVRDWGGEQKIKLGQPMWRERAAQLRRIDNNEVRAHLDTVEGNQGRVDARYHHYILRRYANGWPLRTPADLDAAYEAVLDAPDVTVHREVSRITLYSASQNRLAILEANGVRVTTHDVGANDLARLENPLWTRETLISP